MSTNASSVPIEAQPPEGNGDAADNRQACPPGAPRPPTAPHALYRPEALEGLRSRHGRPAPLFGIASWLLVAFLVAVAAGVLAFLVLSSFTRKETAEGFLQPDSGSATIAFQRPGTVARVFVREGQNVRKGQPLFAISLDQTLDDGRTVGDRLSKANDTQAAEVQAQLVAARNSAQAQEHGSAERIAAAQAQVSGLTANLALQRQRLELDRATLDSYDTLVGKGYVSKVRLRDQQSQVLASTQAINETQRQIAQARGEILAAQAELIRQRSDGASASAQLRASGAALDERRAQNDAERGMVLVAPADGRVVTIRATPGGVVTAGAPLATLLPRNAKLVAELWVPSRAIGFVREGDEVRLMFDAFPFERFGTGKGKVVSISTTPVDPKDLPLPGDAKEALFRVRVALADQKVTAYGRSWPLAPGSRLRGDLILERQSLSAWLLDPLRAVRGRGL
jgi:membrane fusion protein